MNNIIPESILILICLLFCHVLYLGPIFPFQVENMLQNYDWIADEKKYFGKPNTAYDFKENDPKECERRIQKLTDTKDKLAKSVNMRAMNMLGKAEEQVCILRDLIGTKF